MPIQRIGRFIIVPVSSWLYWCPPRYMQNITRISRLMDCGFTSRKVVTVSDEWESLTFIHHLLFVATKARQTVNVTVIKAVIMDFKLLHWTGIGAFGAGSNFCYVLITHGYFNSVRIPLRSRCILQVGGLEVI